MHWQSPATNISFPEWSMKEWMAKPPPQSCHIHQHFEQTLDLTFTCYMSVSFAQHGRTFLLQEEYTWPSPQKLGTVWISHPSNTRTKKNKTKKTHKNPPPHNWNLFCQRSPEHRASSRLFLRFTLFIPLQKRGSPLGQKNLWMEKRTT